MSDANQQTLGILPKLVIAAAILLIAAGILLHGVTLEAVQRAWHDLVDRPGGPMMVGIAAIHDGVKDARTGRSPYFWTVLSKRHERVERLREGLTATARIILLGLAMDVIYQFIVLKTFYPVEALIIALLFAFIPYLLIRGPAARIARRRYGGTPTGATR
jgi:hypothetical protein